MKKSQYGKLSILIILIATLFVSAAIAIFGLSSKHITGANDLSAEIPAPELDASSAIVDGEISNDGSISAPETEATATATVTMTNTMSSTTWATNVVAGNTVNITISSTTYLTSGYVYTIPVGATVNLIISSTLYFYAGNYFDIRGVLCVYHTTSSAGVIRPSSTSTTFTKSPFYVNGGNFWLGSNGPATYYGPSIRYFNVGSGDGGAVYVASGRFAMYAGTIGGGSSYANKAGAGGGVYINSGWFDFSGGTISYNTAGYGGGVYNVNGVFTLSGGTISNNSATSTYGFAGGVYNFGTFNMTSGYIRSNTARDGGGVYTSGTFTMSGGTIGGASSYANSATLQGGGVFVNGLGGTFNFIGGTISYNSATSQGGGVYSLGACSFSDGWISYNNALYGGGAYISTGTCNISGGVIIYYNTATTTGGGVYNDGTCEMEGGSIYGNKATNDYGGGVYNDGTFEMSSGFIRFNSAGMQGGGVYMESGTFTMSGGTIGGDSGSNSVNSATAGGGVYIKGGTFELKSGGTILYNTATSGGGGVYIKGGTVTCSGGIISNNSAYSGGGVYIYSGTFELKSSASYVRNNSATSSGGGVYLYGGTLTITSGYIGGGSDYVNTAKYGGGIYVDGGNVNHNGGYVSYNKSTGETIALGGGGVCVNYGTYNLQGGYIDNNSASYGGGGVYVGGNYASQHGEFNMTSGYIRSNTATYDGGGVMAYSYGEINMTGGYIGGGSSYANTADRGGGVYTHSSSSAATLTLSGTISYNKATTYGGGLYIYSGTITCSGGIISNNSAPSGGGVYVSGGTLELKSSAYIRTNSATSSGGGAYVSSGTLTITSGNIGGGSSSYANTAANGGGVYMSSGTLKLTSTSSYIRTNSATSYGGGVYMSGGTLEMTSGYIGYSSSTYGNTAVLGGGVYMSGGTVNHSGGYIRYNKATSAKSDAYGGGVYMEVGTYNLKGGYIDYNSATYSGTDSYYGYGGGVYVGSYSANSYGTLNITSGYIRSNSATTQGGGVCVKSYGRFSMSGGTIGGSSYGNSAKYGGGVYITSSLSTIEHTISGSATISYNTASVTGGGVWLGGGTLNQESTSSYSSYISYNTVTSSTATVYGGGVYIAGGTYNLKGGYINGNSATYSGSSSYYGYGGGVYVGSSSASSYGTFKMTGGYVRSNSATTYGGGVCAHNYGRFAMEGGTIGGNSGSTTYGNTAKYGAGVFIYSSTSTTAHTVSGGTISYNTASIYGGGIGVYMGTVTMSDGNVSYNKATSSSATTLGGGVCLYIGTFNLEGGTIDNNSATYTGTSAYYGYGGGFYIASSSASSYGTLNISGGDIRSNSATSGGGVYVINYGRFSMSGGTIGGIDGTTTYGNTASSYGGGVYIYSSTYSIAHSITGGTISYNKATSLYGGGLYIYAGTVNFGSSTSTTSVPYILNNTAQNGGGVYVTAYSNTNYGTLNVYSGYISGNAASSTSTNYGLGGGVCVAAYARFAMSGGTIGGEEEKDGNTASVSGGGIYLTASSTTLARTIGGTISNNSATSTGGGVYATSGVVNCTATISNNSAAIGGGVYIISSMTFTISGSADISGNEASNGAGGVYVGTLGTFNMNGGTISENKAVNGGGGLYVISTGVANITNGTISDNEAQYAAGAFAYSGGKITMSGGTITENSATAGYAGGVYVSSGTLTFSGGTISKNTSSSYGGGVCVVSGTFTMSGTAEISENVAGYGGGGVYVFSGTIAMSGGKITGNTSTLSGGGLYLGANTMTIGGTAYIYGNVGQGVDENLYLTSTSQIGFTSKLTTGAKIGITTGVDGVITSGFTTIGHTEADIAAYFDADVVGMTLYYENNEVVSSYDFEYAWNATVQASLDSGAVKTFVVLRNWTATNGSFGAGVGFDNGTILVPANASIILNLSGFTIDKDGAAGSVFKVVGTLEIPASGYGYIVGGNAEYGGGVYVNGGTFTMNSGYLRSNTASMGGGVYIDNGGTVIMNGGEISQNSAENGGGVYVKDGTFTFNDGNIGRANDGTTSYANSATSYGGGVYVDGGGVFTVYSGNIHYNTALSGAGVYINNGKFKLESGNIYSNTATENGGGVYVNGGSFEMTDGNIGASSNVNTAVNGGGLYVASGTATISGGYISNNKATSNGGAVYVAGGRLTISDSTTINNNTATGFGGGIYVNGTNAQVTMEDGSITGNTSAGGLGVYIDAGTFTLNGGKITSHTSTTTGVYGGGVYVNGGTLEVKGGEISSNTVAENGAGIYVAGGSVTMSGGTIGKNTVTATASNGAGVYMAGGAFELKDGTISENTAVKNGGGLYVDTNATLVVTGGNILSNKTTDTTSTASDGTGGGGVYVAGTMTMSAGNIAQNSSVGNGGGVYVGGTFNLNGGTISGNTLTSTTKSYGGGVYVADNAEFTMSDGTISGGKSTHGSGVFVDGGSFSISDGEISSNTASTNGGGVYIFNDGAMTLTGGIISSNTAACGAGICVNGGTATISGGYIRSNTATYGGGGICVFGTTVTMTGGTIGGDGYANTAASVGGGVYVAGGTFTMSDNAVISNNSASQGGGVYVYSNAEFNLTDGTISNNSASMGGGVYVSESAKTFTMSGGEISANTSSGNGGGVYIISSSATISGGSITENKSTDATEGAGGGGVYVKSGTLTVSDSTKITYNSAARYGGGILVDGSANSTDFEMTGGIIGNNTAAVGAGIYATGNFASVTVDGKSMVSENIASNNGGGLAVFSGAKVEVCDNAFLIYNEAANYGGGAYVSDAGSTLTLVDKAAFTSNSAQFGGAVTVASSGAFTMENGTLNYNEATNGGAVYVTTATFTMESGEISANTATVNGGGVYVSTGTASVFKMNGGTIGGLIDSADPVANSAVLGGGVYIAGGKVTLTSGEIKGNTASESGAGVYFSSGTFEISGNPAIYDNLSSDNANNVYLYNGKTITVTGVLSEGAKIGVMGTGQVTSGYTSSGNGETHKAYFFGDINGTVVSISNDEIVIVISLEDAWNAAVQESLDSNKAVQFILAETWVAENGEFGDGAGVGFTDEGALYLPQGAYIILNLNGNTINRNLGAAQANGGVIYIAGKLEISGTAGYITGGATTTYGGGAYIYDGGTLNFNVGSIQYNTATNGGGGVYVAGGGTLNLDGGTIRGNNTSGNGGGVYVETNATFTMNVGTISGNTATNGGVYVSSNAEFNLTGGTISGNTATNGGGVYNDFGTFEMTGGTISGNTATNGGGVYDNNSFTMSGGAISGNTATENGGGVAILDACEFKFSGGTISGNTATSFGGGVYYDAFTSAEMTGGTITDNTATTSGGGVYVAGTGTVVMSDGLITKNEADSSGGGVFVKNKFKMTGGEISGNKSIYGGGVFASSTGSVEISDGLISGNEATTSGGGVYLNGTLTVSGGAISGNTSKSNGGGVYSNGTITVTGGEINENKAATEGGGVYVNVGTFTMSGNSSVSENTATNGGGVYNNSIFTLTDGAINGNECSEYAGSVYVTGNGTFTMNGGTLSGNTITLGGGGVYVLENGTFNFNGGLISGNTAARGGGIYNRGTTTMTGGTISGNTTTNYGGGGIYTCGTLLISGGLITGNTSATYGGGVSLDYGTFTLTGGTVTGNTATEGAGGVFVNYLTTETTTFNLGGSPRVYGNNLNGIENNLLLASSKVINVTGMLSVDGVTAYIGVTMATPGKFTSGFYTNNTAHNPALKAGTVFFSDDTDYMVSTDTDGEAILKDNDYSQTSLIWQLSKDGGKTWATIDAPEYTLRYKPNETYAVRALDGTGTAVAFTWATDSENNSINASSFSGIGSYEFIINSDSYLNPALTFEILPAQLIWQYSTDEGLTWYDLTVDSIVYTGLTYQFRACAFFDSLIVIKTFTDTAKDVGDYSFDVELNTYENPVLDLSITTRYVSVEWNFGDALGNTSSGYYWNYDGLVHAPVAVLNGVDGNLAGIDFEIGYVWSGGENFTAAQAYAGTYTLTLTLKNDDPNIVLSNVTASYEIKGIVLSLVWTDKDGNEGDEFTFEYDGEKHDLSYILTGVVIGDDVTPYITYATRAGRELSEAPTAVGYYTATVKLPADCINYVFDKTYICQIIITQTTLKVEWGTNDDGTYTWTFNGQGKAPEVSIINTVTGEELTEAYTIEYAPVADSGAIGVFTAKKPVNAGNYIVRVTLDKKDGNFVLDESTMTQYFTIAKMAVTVTWTGGTYDGDTDVYYWSYDGEEHDITAEIKLLDGDVYKDGVIIASLDVVRKDAQKKLTDVGSATATVELASSSFNDNFYIVEGASQVYEVRKALISSVVWTDAFKNEYNSDDKPEYDFGTISGVNGPAFEAIANGTLQLVISYSKTYEGDWVVDETVGYIAYASLSEADAKNYEFEEGAENATLTFFIMSVGGYKSDIDVTWVVFINEYEYVLLEDYLLEKDFVYNGKVQYPTPIYVKKDNTYEILAINESSVGADAGEYIARLQPSSVYNFKEEDLTCKYVIQQLEISIAWKDGKDDSDTTFTYTYDGTTSFAPYAYAAGDSEEFDLTTIVVTVEGNVNAGTYTATAIVGDNFKITSGETQQYKINQLGIASDKVVWNFTDAGASGDENNGWYWVFDGDEHAPTATITLSSLGITLELVVTGETSQIGTHTAYAVLNSSLAEHNNFYLIGTASAEFEIVQVKAGQVYWEDESGHTYEDGKGGDTGLTFTYNGDVDGQKPKAYYVDGEGNKVYLTVTVIGGTAVDAGTYTAYVSSDLDFDSALPSCTFKIEAMEIEVTWDDKATFTFNGKEQAPSVTLSAGADGHTLVEGVDYEIVGFTNAGEHTAQIKFLNNNYVCADADRTFDFEIGKIELTDNDFTWDTTDGYDAETDSYFWQYDGDEHYPTLTINYSIDGVDVEFEIGYYGVTSGIGTHTVTAYVKSATLNGVDVTDNFTIEADMEYAINAVSVGIEWDWGDAEQKEDENGETYYEWTFDTEKHAPKAYLVDAEGNRIQDANGDDIELDVYGAEINARAEAYTATAVVPSEYNFTGDATVTYFIKAAEIEVKWEITGDGVEEKVDEDGNTYYEWTYGDEVEIKAYFTDNNGVDRDLDLTGKETDAGDHTLTVMQSDGNYTFASADDATMRFVINPKTVYVIWYGEGGIDNDDTTDFDWTYGGTNTVPTAYLAEYDENGELQLIKNENGEAIKVEVNGASNEIGTHEAQVVNTFVNYVFANDAELTKEFTIAAKEATDFKWTAEGAEVTGNATDGFTFTYEYSGGNNLPVPTSSIDGIEFNVTIKDASGNTVLSITERGEYTVEVTSRDSNYKIPDGLDKITVVVTAKTVEVKWDVSGLVYNGENQMPKAYYEVNGNKIELEVTVEGDSKNAGKYTATASQPTDTNYVLGEDVTKEFEITAKTIKVEWGDNEFEYNGTEQATLPVIILTSDEKDGITRIVYEITDKSGTVVAGSDFADKKVVNAGEYTVKVWLEGTAAGNYQLDKDEFIFNINKKEVTITATDEKTLDFGEKLTLTIGDVEISGLVDDEKEELTAKLAASLNQWLISWYIQYSEPGEYTIYVEADWINDNLLSNYKVVGVNGLLTVNPVDGELVWVADKYVEDEDGNSYPVFTYDGTVKLPKVYYYVGSEKHYLNDNVKLATYDADTDTYTVIDDPETVAKNVGTYYAVIVDGEGNIITGIGGNKFTNSGVMFEIVKREIVITVNTDGFAEWKYGDVSEETVEDLLGLDKGFFIGNVKPLADDDLGITLEIVESFENGFLNAGTYTIVVKWNEADFGDNYTLTVVAGDRKITEVESNTDIFSSELAKAEIEVDLDKSGDYFYNDYTILTNGQFECDFIDNPENFIGIAGYQGAEITIRFSKEWFAKGQEPSLENVEFSNDTPAAIEEAGEYVLIFRITVDNHEEFTGKLLVKAVDKENTLYVTVKGNVEKSYGELEVTDELAQWLFANSYAHYDSDLSPETVTEELFLKWVTATVTDEDGNEVTSGKLGVGTYKVTFGLSSEAPDKYGIHVNDSKHLYIEITKFELVIDWGDEDNLNYEYDGELHMPVITLKGVTDENGDPVKLTVGENVITINGETVKLTVTVDGDFTTAGGHSIHVSVDNGNFVIDEENALCSVSITEPAKEIETPSGEVVKRGLEDWQLGLIIGSAALLALLLLILLILLLKRRKEMGDDDGFYDPIDESDV